MNFSITIRKLLCLFCIILVFFISNSFLYEIVTFQTNSVSGQEPISEQESAGDDIADDISVSYDQDGLTAEEVAAIDDDDVLLAEERTDYGEVDSENTFTLSDVISSASGISANETLSMQGHTGNAYEVGIESFRRSDWRLVLINKQHSIPEDYTFTLGTIKGNMKCDERIIPELTELMQAAKQDGITLVICSPYRDYDRQIMLFNRKIKAYMKKKMTYLEAYRVTAQAVTVPGASEHQIGLALDIISDSYSSLNEGFGETAAGQWLAAHSYEYGFILRYPQGKEDITGIEYEPWHFRYVGKEAAAYIHNHALTLEEFVSQLEEE